MINEFELLKEISYIRTGGSNEELKCAETLKSVIEEMGVDAWFEEFPVQGSIVEKGVLKAVEPEREISCKPYFCCASGDIKGEFIFLKDPMNKLEQSLVKDKIVAIQGYLRYWMFKDLYEAGAKGIIVSDGYWYDEKNDDIDQRELREPLREIGQLPIVQINTKDLFWLLKNDVKEVEMSVSLKDNPGVSRNVVATVKGESEDTIVFTAHYDSTSLSYGSWDNGSGAVALIKAIEYFRDNKPKRTLTFIFCGSEERGLLGSKAYTVMHENELDKIMLDINIDMIGGIVAPFKVAVTAEKAFVDYLDYFAKIKGIQLSAFRDIASTDSTPFADKGVPGIAFTTYSTATPFHNRYDCMEVMSEKELHEQTMFILDLSIELANAEYMPVKRIIEDDLKEKIDVYMMRKRQD